MDQYLFDEINSVKDLIMPTRPKIRMHAVKQEYVIFVNSSPISKVFACAIIMYTKSVDSVRSHIVYTNDDASTFVESFMADNGIRDKFEDGSLFGRGFIYSNIDEFINNNNGYKYKDIRLCTFLDSTNNMYDSKDAKSAYLAELDRILQYALNTPNVRHTHTAQIPSIKPLPNGMTSVSEREYEVYASQFDDNSAEQFVLACEETIRAYDKQGVKSVATRVINLFGPSVDNAMIDSLANDINTNNTVNVDTADCNKYFGLTYIRYAASSVFAMFNQGKSFNIYNVQQFIATPYSCGTQVYEYFNQYQAKLNCANTAPATEQYAMLCNKKLTSKYPAKYKKMELGDCLYRSVLTKVDLEYFDINYLFRYDGKLDLVKQLEMEMMDEVKRICDKHNIKYFLVGGSLLGAVRHKGFIPWDDDLDVGMLREDFDKFKKVAPAELNERFAYQSYTTEGNSHYIFDKIRLKDTFFTTKFSNMFEIENGLFLDILIYDRTSKIPFLQKMHTNALRRQTRILSIRWVNKPRKNVAYKFSKIALPFMRFIPTKCYQSFFNVMLKWYKHTKNPYVIDGVGQNIERGAFPIEWLEETVDAPFEDRIYPIPKMYNEYLTHWYGENYMSLLPISTRNSGHLLQRIDMGSYATRFGFDDGNYHHASKVGELLDKTDSELIEGE